MVGVETILSNTCKMPMLWFRSRMPPGFSRALKWGFWKVIWSWECYTHLWIHPLRRSAADCAVRTWGPAPGLWLQAQPGVCISCFVSSFLSWLPGLHHTSSFSSSTFYYTVSVLEQNVHKMKTLVKINLSCGCCVFREVTESTSVRPPLLFTFHLQVTCPVSTLS